SRGSPGLGARPPGLLPRAPGRRRGQAAAAGGGRAGLSAGDVLSLLRVGVHDRALAAPAPVPATGDQPADDRADRGRDRGSCLSVPPTWPVFDLWAHPGTCVRFNRHAVYLGRPGADQQCPAQAAGRTEAILVEPLSPPGVERHGLPLLPAASTPGADAAGG